MEPGRVRIHDDEWVIGEYRHGFMAFIHEVNRICTERGIEPVFGEPTRLGKWWTGQFAEEYPRARVIHPFEKGRGEGYRIATDDPELFEVWTDAWTALEPRLEIRKQ